jgi:hypothetical protein
MDASGMLDKRAIGEGFEHAPRVAGEVDKMPAGSEIPPVKVPTCRGSMTRWVGDIGRPSP